VVTWVVDLKRWQVERWEVAVAACVKLQTASSPLNHPHNHPLHFIVLSLSIYVSVCVCFVTVCVCVFAHMCARVGNGCGEHFEAYAHFVLSKERHKWRQKGVCVCVWVFWVVQEVAKGVAKGWQGKGRGWPGGGPCWAETEAYVSQYIHNAQYLCEHFARTCEDVHVCLYVWAIHLLHILKHIHTHTNVYTYIHIWTLVWINFHIRLLKI